MQHAKKMPYIVTIYVGDRNVPKSIVVADALFCGVCKPQPEPIEMPELF
jgi:hypothetical protein